MTLIVNSIKQLLLRVVQDEQATQVNEAHREGSDRQGNPANKVSQGLLEKL